MLHTLIRNFISSYVLVCIAMACYLGVRDPDAFLSQKAFSLACVVLMMATAIDMIFNTDGSRSAKRHYSLKANSLSAQEGSSLTEKKS